MPIKWTPENDQILLLKILETHDLTVDTKKVSEAWRMYPIPPLSQNASRQTHLTQSPAKTDANAIPTARAITERLFKIKKSAKESINGMATTPKKPPTSAKTTPSTASARKRKTNTAQTPASKRGRTAVKREPEMDMPSSPLAMRGHIKQEPAAHESDAALEEMFSSLPDKRVRMAPCMPQGLVAYDDDDEGADDDDNDKYASDASEYVAEDTEIDDADEVYVKGEDEFA
ncbi:hypothetical protein PRK78_001827 [Emydomyces testavorans]|uniref:Uncharacterized protein n=1 Tax=Emydomyces testavorans TaxID=2070801 RepID=A0AAF0IJ19_9EURO|nr:hypothetical protein PRK78_001827 [Emydomyces testavorans]